MFEPNTVDIEKRLREKSEAFVLNRMYLANYRPNSFKAPPAFSNPLQFWENHATEYPVMSETARRLLCILASSAQSERDFSSVGRTVTDMRSRFNIVKAIELLRWGMRAWPITNQ